MKPDRAIRKLLVANRGEIAVRVIQAAQEMGIGTVAIYSDPDRNALHVRLADEAYPLDGSIPLETYLDIERMVGIGVAGGADAVHPGYGFLSEREAFATAVCAAGMAFVGPPPSVLAAVGDKLEARRRMQAAGVPVIPGVEVGDLVSEIELPFEFPVMVKAVAGGGGKGMRRVDSAEDLQAALESAAREAEKAFGDGRLYVEQLLERPRHVEVQIFGDSHGNVGHLFERECSLQRRHQKVIEESPAPSLDGSLREQITAAAVAAARAVGYQNAGTIEFLIDGEGNFYFLEVNARLQVEHPVTEMVTGIDLVREQIRVAAGHPLSFSNGPQSTIPRGHAIEARVYAEDPERDFLPMAGRLAVYREPRCAGVRVDSGVSEGDEITPYYDPLIAKVIAHGRARDEAIEKLDWALGHFVILGVVSNIDYLRRLLADAAFRAGDLHTGFLAQNKLGRSTTSPPMAALASAAAAARARPAGHSRKMNRSRSPSPWSTSSAWRLS